MSNTFYSIEKKKPFSENSGINQIHSKLINQDHISEEGADWHCAVLKDIEFRLGGDSGFPCVFSKNAFRNSLLKFIFVKTVDKNGIQHLAEGLQEYVEISRRWDGNLNTAYPLVVAFSLDAITTNTVENYHAFGWNILQKLHEIDPQPWPNDVAKDPKSPSWSMCFNGMQLFCNMSSPAHKVRRSRNLGEHFIIIINPRERFDVFAGDSLSGRKVRSNIRNRISRYDGIPHSLQLGTYGAGDTEWKQYGIIEKNTARADKCSFIFKKRLVK